MDRLETYKEWYYKELERQNSLEDSLNFPFGIVSSLRVTMNEMVVRMIVTKTARNTNLNFSAMCGFNGNKK